MRLLLSWCYELQNHHPPYPQAIIRFVPPQAHHPFTHHSQIKSSPFFRLILYLFSRFLILNFSFAIFEQTLSFLIEEFDFYAIAYASNDFSIKRFLIAFLKMTFFFLFLSVLRLKSRNKDQPGDVKNGG